MLFNMLNSNQFERKDTMVSNSFGCVTLAQHNSPPRTNTVNVSALIKRNVKTLREM